MNFNSYYTLDSKSKEEFTRLINVLLNQTFIVERKYNISKDKMEINKDYKFIESNKELLVEYFSIMGYSLKENYRQGVFYLVNNESSNYVNLNKLTTIYLLVLKLLFEEKQGVASLNNNVIVSLDEIHKKIEIFKLFNKIPAISAIKSSFSILKKYQIVEKIKGNYESDTRFIIYPSIIHILSNDDILNILSHFEGEKEDLIENDSND